MTRRPPTAARQLDGIGSADPAPLAPVRWNGPPPAPDATCAAWTLSADGTTYTCSQPVQDAGVNLKRIAQYALIAAGFVAGAVAYQKRSLPAYVAANAVSLGGAWWLYADGGSNVVWPVLSTAATVAGGASLALKGKT